jgi:hypothetical protein
VEADRFDHLIRVVTARGTRRGALGLLLGSSAGVLGISVSSGKKKRKGKKKKKTGCRGGCPAGAICSGKVCVFCASGQVACRNACVSLDDRNNCGACGNACPAGSSCQSGACRFCDTGMTQCGDTCVNLATDPANCGRCGHVCATGSCLNGACKCGLGDACPAGCSCIHSAQGGGYCGSSSTGRHCDNYLCPLGEVCEAGSNGYCYAACSG